MMSDEQTTIIKSEPTPMGLLSAALDRGVSPEELSQWMDLEKRFKKEVAEKAYIAAMNRCHQRMPIVVRDAENRQTSSRYARLETVANGIKPIYAEEGFTLEFSEAESHLPNHRRIECEVQHVGGHAKRFHLDSPIDDVGAKGASNKTAVQGLGSMISYLRRYLTLMIFNITIADTDNDGNGAGSTISDNAVATLNDMLAECRKVGNPVEGRRLVKFLETVGVAEGGTLADIDQSKFLQAVSLLTKCIAARKPEEAKA